MHRSITSSSRSQISEHEVADRSIQIPPELRSLQDQLVVLTKEATQLHSQIETTELETKRHRKVQKDLENSVGRILDANNSMKASKIVSLREYWELRVMLPVHRGMLDKTIKKIKSFEDQIKTLQIQLKQVDKDLALTKHRIASWNKLIMMPRK
jgi:phage shock protein A